MEYITPKDAIATVKLRKDIDKKIKKSIPFYLLNYSPITYVDKRDILIEISSVSDDNIEPIHFGNKARISYFKKVPPDVLHEAYLYPKNRDMIRQGITEIETIGACISAPLHWCYFSEIMYLMEFERLETFPTTIMHVPEIQSFIEFRISNSNCRIYKDGFPYRGKDFDIRFDARCYFLLPIIYDI